MRRKFGLFGAGGKKGTMASLRGAETGNAEGPNETRLFQKGATSGRLRGLSEVVRAQKGRVHGIEMRKGEA